MTDPITSLQNSKVKLANALLGRARTRKKENKIVLEGTRLIADAYQSGAVPLFVLHTPGTDDALVEQMDTDGVEIAPVDDTVMQYITDTQSPQGIVGVFSRPQPTYPLGAGRVLILDAIRDPGNLGTMLRTAGGAGVQAVVLAPGCVDPYNPKVLRGGMGAHFRLPVLEMTWDDIQERVDVSAFYLAAGEADTHYNAVPWAQHDWALIIGSEAHGASDPARQTATVPVAIPMHRATESINAAAAAAVILFEAARQRRAVDD